MRLSSSMILLFGVVVWSHSALGALLPPQSWNRGESGTTYQHWDVFDIYPTDNTPDVGNLNTNGTASLTVTGSALLTGGGNIYSPSSATSFSVTIPEADIPTPAHNVTALVQLKTAGTELDYSSVLLNGLAPVETAKLSRVAAMGGSTVETWFLFQVPYASFGDGVAGVENLTLAFNASGAHMSLDQLAIDTAIRPFGFYAEPNPAAVPEPSAMAILALGGILVVGMRRKFDRQARLV